MSHFAKVENGVVTEVIVATQSEINTEHHGDAFLWVQASYNNNFRKNFAAVGDVYDRTRDAFMSAQPYPSWLLDEDTYQWVPPTLDPTVDIMVEPFEWDESSVSWVVSEVTP